MNEFTFGANYNEELAQYIDELFLKDKSDKLPRQERLDSSDRLIEAYVLRTGKRPPSAQLGRLATLILRDELADPHPDKMTREEYPILSDEQHARRTEGRHIRRTNKDGKPLPNKTEIPLQAAYDYGEDGKNYRQPLRRRLSTDEALHVDRNLSKDRDRRIQYERQLKPSKVEVSIFGD